MPHWSDPQLTEHLPRDLTRFDPCLLQKLPRRPAPLYLEGGDVER